MKLLAFSLLLNTVSKPRIKKKFDARRKQSRKNLIENMSILKKKFFRKIRVYDGVDKIRTELKEREREKKG